MRAIHPQSNDQRRKVIVKESTEQTSAIVWGNLVKVYCTILLAAFGFSDAFALTIPPPSDPWKAKVPATCDAYGLCQIPPSLLDGMESAANNDELFAYLLQVLMLPRVNDEKVRVKAKAELGRLALNGDIKARIVYLGRFMYLKNLGQNDDYNAQVFASFEDVDRLEDPRAIYEIAKLLQLGYVNCLNVVDAGGVKTVNQFCHVYHDKAATRNIQDEFKGRYVGYFLQSANGGYGLAQYELGLIMFRELNASPPNKGGEGGLLGGRTALEWINKAAETVPEAKLFLSEMAEEKNLNRISEQKERALEEEHRKNRPQCNFIRFTGVASAGGSNLIEQALRSRDVEDTLARNPIRCGQMGCYGVAYFTNHRARIESWSKSYFMVASPVDFNTGRRDIFLYIRRADAVCQK